MTADSCQRCGERIKGTPAVLAIERDGIPLDGSPLSLCAHCVRSYERWLERRQMRAPKVRANPSEPAAERPARRRSSRRSFLRKHRKALIGFAFLAAALFGSALLMSVVLRNFERSHAAAEAGP